MVKFIAEVSSNHHCSLDRCIEFIDTAAKISCYGVKFQLFKIDQLFSSEILEQSERHRERKKWELPVEFLPDLAKRCKRHGLKFGCTPFYLDAVDVLLPYVDFFKVSSYELLWHELISKCAMTSKPLIVSTGMADIPEVSAMLDVVDKTDCDDLTLLHCVSNYPVPARQCNLSAIETLRTITKYPVGWSDHSVNPAVIYRAVFTWRANVIEFHLDLDKHGEEYEAGHCWLPDKISKVISTVNEGFLADGNGKKFPQENEIVDREWRADPDDGLRPLLATREQWAKKKR